MRVQPLRAVRNIQVGPALPVRGLRAAALLLEITKEAPGQTPGRF